MGLPTLVWENCTTAESHAALMLLVMLAEGAGRTTKVWLMVSLQLLAEMELKTLQRMVLVPGEVNAKLTLPEPRLVHVPLMFQLY